MSVESLSNERKWPEIAEPFKLVAEIAVVACIYVVMAKLSLTFASIHPNTTPIWPTAGFALACLFLRGYRVAPAIYIGSFLVNATTAGSILTSLAIAGGNTVEGLVTALLINEWARGRNVFERPVNVGKLLFACFAPGAALSATIGLASLHLGGYVEPSGYRALWTTWWMGDSSGMLVVAPALVLWGRHWRQVFEPGELLRSACLYLGTILIGLLAFSPLFEQTAARTALAFFAVVPLMWAAVRRNPRDTATVALLLSAFAVWGTMKHGGPFMRSNLNESFLLLLAFMVTATAPSLALSAEVIERKRQKDQVDFVLRELSHRSKNLLAVVQSMAAQVARRSTGFDAFYKGYTARLRALAEIHDLLVGGDWRGADIRDLVRKQMRPFNDGSGTSIVTAGPPLMLNPRAAEQIGLALHELGTNAVKHGALSVAGGTVEIGWEIEHCERAEAQFRFTWRESGGPAVRELDRQGFGHILLTKVVPGSLEGTASLEFNPDGFRCTLCIPAEHVLPEKTGIAAMTMNRASENRAPAQGQPSRVRERITA